MSTGELNQFYLSQSNHMSVVDRISKTTLFYPCLCDMELMKNNEIEYNRQRQTKSLFLVRTTVVSKCQKCVPLKMSL